MKETVLVWPLPKVAMSSSLPTILSLVKIDKEVRRAWRAARESRVESF